MSAHWTLAYIKVAIKESDLKLQNPMQLLEVNYSNYDSFNPISLSNCRRNCSRLVPKFSASNSLSLSLICNRNQDFGPTL